MATENIYASGYITKTGLISKYGSETILSGTLVDVMSWMNLFNIKPFQVKSFIYDTVTSEYVAIVIRR